MDLTGNILIAPPAVKGNFWYKTVILITESHNHGHVGVVLNKRSDVSIREFGEQIGMDIDIPGYVYVGGPVNVKSLTFLHSNDWSCKNTLQISPHFRISSADDILPRLAMGDCPNQFRLFLGMCGWGPGQLHGEIKGIPPWNQQTSWCLAKGDPNLIYENDGKDQWCQALDRSAQEFAHDLLT
jgi:putative transcriptional regulator